MSKKHECFKRHFLKTQYFGNSGCVVTCVKSPNRWHRPQVYLVFLDFEVHLVARGLKIPPFNGIPSIKNSIRNCMFPVLCPYIGATCLSQSKAVRLALLVKWGLNSEQQQAGARPAGKSFRSREPPHDCSDSILHTWPDRLPLHIGDVCKQRLGGNADGRRRISNGR